MANRRVTCAPGESVYLVERYWPGARSADLDLIAAQFAGGSSESARYLGSALIPEEEAVFCFFVGTSADAVAALNEESGVPFDRVVAVEFASGGQ